MDCCVQKCVQCCLETEMPLSEEDVERIKSLGFDYDFFVVNADNWLQLKNIDGKCAFNDGKQCLIYENRPEGCRLYPITYDEDGAVLDEDCPHKEEFKISKAEIKMVSSLVRKLKDERKQRMK
ncbi:MAG: YkgJ family cysteine cluster protein [Candidatus Aenigmatarchaeota archaeon]